MRCPVCSEKFWAYTVFNGDSTPYRCHASHTFQQTDPEEMDSRNIDWEEFFLVMSLHIAEDHEIAGLELLASYQLTPAFQEFLFQFSELKEQLTQLRYLNLNDSSLSDRQISKLENQLRAELMAIMLTEENASIRTEAQEMLSMLIAE